MGEKKEVYYWHGKGELKIDKLYSPGKQIPHEKMDKKQFAKMVKDGRIKKTQIDLADSDSDSDLKKQNKKLAAQIVELNKSDDKVKIAELGEKITELETKANEDADKIADFEADAKTDGEKITELENKVKELTPKAE